MKNLLLECRYGLVDVQMNNLGVVSQIDRIAFNEFPYMQNDQGFKANVFEKINW